MKYYIQSGQLQVVIAAPHIETPEDAACEALLTYVPQGAIVAPLILVSERGHEFNTHDMTEDVVLATVDMLRRAGMLEDEQYEY